MKTIADRLIRRHGDAWLFDGTQDNRILLALTMASKIVIPGSTQLDTTYVFKDNSMIYFTDGLMRSK